MSGIDFNANLGPATAKLQVRLMGKPRVLTDSGQTASVPRKALLLLAYLILDRRGKRLSRQAAASFLWGEQDRSRQNGNLRTLIMRVKAIGASLQGADLLEATDDDIGVGQAVLPTDVEIIAAALASQTKHGILTICEAYTGELLEGGESAGESAGRWLIERRAALHREVTEAATRYLENDDAGHQPVHALTVAQKLLEIEPTHETGHRTLMQLRADAGDIKAVRTSYGKLKRALRKEMQVLPSKETQSFYASVLSAGPDKLGNPRASGNAIEPALAPPPMVATINRNMPRVIIIGSHPIDVSAVDREIFANIIDDIGARIWKASGFVMSAPELFSTSDLLVRRKPAPAEFDYTIEIVQRRSIMRHEIAIKLVDQVSREIIWTDIFPVKDAMVDNIDVMCQSMVRHVESAEINKLSQSAEQATAYRLTLQGLRFLRALDLPEIRRARRSMKAALAVSPDYVPALAGFARSLVLEGLLSAKAEEHLLDEAESLSRKIILLDPDSSKGFQELGVTKLYKRQFDGSVELLHEAKRLNPHDFDINLDLSDAFLCLGDPAEALSILSVDSTNAPVNHELRKWFMASANFSLSNYKEAIKNIESMKNPAPVSRISAASYAMLGDLEGARRMKEVTLDFNPIFDVKQWLAQSPLGSREIVQQYEYGLFLAGFD